MKIVKHIVSRVSGYWIHKINTLPIGVDLFFDINVRLKYPDLKIVFDVGANEGQTLKWIKHNRPQSMVYSFEPVQSSFLKLQETAERIGACIPVNSALGSQSGKMDIKLFEEYSVLNSLNPALMNNDTNAKVETVRIDTLDNYCTDSEIPHIDLLKIDTEGFELEVLKGAKNLLLNGNISFIYAEVGFQSSNKRNTPFKDLTDFLEKEGFFFYALYQIDDHDWMKGNHLGNALFINRNIYSA